jgi:hypothetical protein
MPKEERAFFQRLSVFVVHFLGGGVDTD